MDLGSLTAGGPIPGLPVLFAALVGVAMMMVWLAFSPSRPQRQVDERMEGYLERARRLEEVDLGQPFVRRALWPALRSLLRGLGRLTPQRSAAKAQHLLVQAGQPGGLTALDYFGLRILSALLLGGVYFFTLGRDAGLFEGGRNALLLGLLGYFIPWYWLRSTIRRRKHRILRALPDALDMLTIGVEAGLAFESALLKVAERWDNPLTREFRRAVAEMRVGTSRDEALQRMADRTGVPDLNTFVAVLIQSSQLGVSIAQVLHSQAAQMRIRRRQRAEELARQAGVKMIFPLGILILPALLVVILGPAVPALMYAFSAMGSAGGLP